MIVVFNKTDVADPAQVKTWLQDYAVFAVMKFLSNNSKKFNRKT